jgi:hypothetical protein
MQIHGRKQHKASKRQQSIAKSIGEDGAGGGNRTHDLAIIDRALCQLSYPWIQLFKLVPGAGVEPAGVVRL